MLYSCHYTGEKSVKYVGSSLDHDFYFDESTTEVIVQLSDEEGHVSSLPLEMVRNLAGKDKIYRAALALIDLHYASLKAQVAKYESL